MLLTELSSMRNQGIFCLIDAFRKTMECDVFGVDIPPNPRVLAVLSLAINDRQRFEARQTSRRRLWRHVLSNFETIEVVCRSPWGGATSGCRKFRLECWSQCSDESQKEEGRETSTTKLELCTMCVFFFFFFVFGAVDSEHRLWLWYIFAFLGKLSLESNEEGLIVILISPVIWNWAVTRHTWPVLTRLRLP